MGNSKKEEIIEGRIVGKKRKEKEESKGGRKERGKTGLRKER